MLSIRVLFDEAARLALPHATLSRRNALLSGLSLRGFVKAKSPRSLFFRRLSRLGGAP
jgi:hypothetical protein